MDKTKKYTFIKRNSLYVNLTSLSIWESSTDFY